VNSAALTEKKTVSTGKPLKNQVPANALDEHEPGNPFKKEGGINPWDSDA
jgi:hypothetical protein